MIDPVTLNTPPATDDAPKKNEDAAKQFEALLLGQMLRSMRDSGWGEEDDAANSTMLDVADQQFSQMLASNGGFGIARLIVNGLKQPESPSGS